MRPGHLDKALIADTDPARALQLAARAAILTSPRFRKALAAGLERLLRSTHRRANGPRVLPRRSAVSANASELREMVDLLRGPSVLYARGIALAAQLVTDGMGPAYLGDGDALRRQLQRARAAMAGSERPGSPSEPARREPSQFAHRRGNGMNDLNPEGDTRCTR